MITTPPFVRPSDSDVAEFITRTAARSSLPLIIFNAPTRTGFLMSTPLIARVAAEVDLLVAIKESSRDIVQFDDVRRRCRESFACLQGVDSLYLVSLVLGGVGGILAAAAAFPEYCLAIERALAAGDVASARAAHDRLMPLVKLLYEASHPAPLKVALAARGLSAGATRPPLYGISEDLQQRVASCVKSLEADVSQLLSPSHA
jgi:4-hydroxy-tetrahydrodipicolinate synthase